MSKKLALVVFASLLLFAAVGNADETCVAHCHTRLSQGDFVHGPVAVKQCEVCHVSTGHHSFVAISNVPATCNKCHDMQEQLGSFAHSTTANCTECHDPHSGTNKYQIRTMQAKS
jgi:hypothetical protein